MANDNKLQAAVEFLLSEHLVGEPTDDFAKKRFAIAKAHRDALENKAEEATLSPPSVPKVG